MTVTSTVRVNTYSGSNITGPYPFTFRIYVQQNLVVQTTDPSGTVTTLLYGRDYAIPAASIGARTGGTVTLTNALGVGWTLTLSRVLPFTQLINYRNQGATFPQNVEDGFDQVVMICQQLDDGVGALIEEVTTNTTNITNLTSQVTTNTTNITALTTNVTNLSSSITTINTQLTTINTEIADLFVLIEQGVSTRPPIRVPTVYTTPGAASHVVSAQCTGRVEYELNGGGGGFNPDSAFTNPAGGGGAYAWGTAAVVVGQTITIQVGAAGGLSLDATSSTINSTDLVAGGGGTGTGSLGGDGAGGVASGTLAVKLLENGLDGAHAGQTAPSGTAQLSGEFTVGGDSPHGGRGAQHLVALITSGGNGGCETFVKAGVGGGGVYTADLSSYPANGRVIVWEYQ